MDNLNNLFNNLFNNGFFNRSFFNLSNDASDNFPSDNDPNFNKIEENIDTEGHTIKKESWTSLDGQQRYERSTMISKKDTNKLKEPTAKELQKMLDQAVEDQDYEKAIKYRDQLKDLQIKQLKNL